ncbi:MAG: signal recognition particle protein [Puniceicoccales bacterium]|jgi:signal recognition particle subunit SRP54|nr:signal recognition particle protein [Puniceicoccales bacterium]
MFESLADRMGKALRNLRGLGKLSESNMADALGEVRTALLSADVQFQVARDFVERVKQICLGQAVISGVNPGQMAVKIIHDELVKLLGSETAGLATKRPLRIMLVGLHGSGKTTSAAKLARHLARKEGCTTPALIACDVYRPAAIDQLEALANAEKFLCYADRNERDVPKLAAEGLDFALKNHADAIIFDTAGRLQIDETLIGEIKKLRERVQPDEVLLVADAALGQEAVNVAKHFHEAVALTGIVLTKLDGDARGGAALSMKTVTGVPIKFMGHGEKVENFDVFHPDRMAQRILGMGDVVSLVEKAQEVVDEKEAERLAAKMRRADFNLEDFLAQMQQIKKMGPLGGLMKMIPGMGAFNVGEKEERMMRRTEAIIQSMTVQERRKPEILNGSRRLRIAKGSGSQVSDVNALLKQFEQMRKMMKMMRGGQSRELMQMFGGKGGGGGGGGGGFPGFGGGFPRL